MYIIYIYIYIYTQCCFYTVAAVPDQPPPAAPAIAPTPGRWGRPSGSIGPPVSGGCLLLGGPQTPFLSAD